MLKRISCKILLTFLWLGLILSPYEGRAPNILASIPSSSNVSPYPTQITPQILLSGDAAIDAFCAGNGTNGLTPATIHVIENLMLYGTEPHAGVEITNTDRFLLFRNCTT